MYSAIMTYFFLLLLSFTQVFSAPTNGTDESGLEKRVTHTGRGTWFNPGLGHCGNTDNDNSMIVAIGESRYDANNGANCQQWMQITNTKNGKSVYAKTRDSCPGCGENDLDMSPAVFKKLSTLGTGVISVQWHFMAKGWQP